MLVRCWAVVVSKQEVPEVTSKQSGGLERAAAENVGCGKAST
jgi:hypothetical protein